MTDQNLGTSWCSLEEFSCDRDLVIVEEASARVCVVLASVAGEADQADVIERQGSHAIPVDQIAVLRTHLGRDLLEPLGGLFIAGDHVHRHFEGFCVASQHSFHVVGIIKVTAIDDDRFYRLLRKPSAVGLNSCLPAVVFIFEVADDAHHEFATLFR